MHTYSEHKVSLEMHGFSVKGRYFVDNFGEAYFRVEFFRKDVLWYRYTEDTIEGNTLSEYKDGVLVDRVYHHLGHVTIGRRDFENHWTHKYIQMVKKQVRDMRNMIA